MKFLSLKINIKIKERGSFLKRATIRLCDVSIY